MCPFHLAQPDHGALGYVHAYLYADFVPSIGIATIGEGLITSVGGLIAMRFLLGLFEAGLFPGAVYLISM